MTKYTAQTAYEEDVRRQPLYHTSEPRKTWGQLGHDEKLSWDRYPTPRNY